MPQMPGHFCHTALSAKKGNTLYVVVYLFFLHSCRKKYGFSRDKYGQ